jgi:hypothetical protein
MRVPRLVRWGCHFRGSDLLRQFRICTSDGVVHEHRPVSQNLSYAFISHRLIRDDEALELLAVGAMIRNACARCESSAR